MSQLKSRRKSCLNVNATFPIAFLSRTLMEKTMDDKFIYIPNDNKQSCKVKLLVEKFRHY